MQINWIAFLYVVYVCVYVCVRCVYGVYGVWVCLGNTKPDIVYLIRATLRDR